MTKEGEYSGSWDLNREKEEERARRIIIGDEAAVRYVLQQHPQVPLERKSVFLHGLRREIKSHTVPEGGIQIGRDLNKRRWMNVGWREKANYYAK